MKVLPCLSSIIFTSTLLITTVSSTPRPILEWTACPSTISSSATVPFECATLLVPLDYTNTTSNSTLSLDLFRAPALENTTTPTRSILFNFGGPGGNTAESLTGNAALLHTITGGSFNLVGFNVRGTGSTIPFDCFGSSALNATGRGEYNLLRPGFVNSSSEGTSELWAVEKAFAEKCRSMLKDTGRFVGTAFVARDMMRVVDALEEDGLLRYWGLSYGTTLGATLAAMFPERVENVVLDGVQNVHEYYHAFPREMFTDTDATLYEFFKACVDHAEDCALIPLFPNATALTLQASFYDLLETLKSHPITLDLVAFPSIPIASSLVTYNSVKSLVGAQLYNPIYWPTTSTFLSYVFTRNTTALSSTLASPESPVLSKPALDYDANSGITCSDNIVRSSDSSILDPVFENLGRTSRFLADFATTNALCPQWGLNAAQRYGGDFIAKTKKPLLLVGNTWDPVTPLISARNVSAGFDGSVVLEHHGHGHTSLGQISICTAHAIRAYFVNGTLPAPGTVCAVDQALYTTLTWQDILLPNGTISRRSIG